MEPQTESHTEVRERDTDFACFVKAKDKGEVTFTLRAQDITADLFVELWARGQEEIRECIANGLSVQEAIDNFRWDHGLKLPIDRTGDMKLDEALTIAEAMRQHPNRKLAD